MRRYLAVAALVAYFLFWVFRGAYTYLNSDDVTSIYHSLEVSFGTIVKGVVFFWSGHLRPLGYLFYRLIYELAGIHALPFRYASLALLILNLLLQVRFLEVLTRSGEIALLAAFFGCFHSELWDIFSSSGSIFDVLCYTFYVSLLIYYVRIRERGLLPSPRQIAVLCVLTALALDSKEMGATIPIILLCYEAVFHPGPRFLRNCLAAAATGVAVLAFVIGWFLSVTVNTGNPAYAPALTVERYFLTTRAYLTHLFAGTIQFTTVEAVCFLVFTVLLGIWIRSRLLVFGWLFYVVTLLPMSFVPPRATGYALYLPMIGCGLYLAVLFVWLMDRAAIRSKWRIACCASFVGLAAYSHYRENQYLVRVNAGPGAHIQIRGMVDDFRRLYPTMPRDTRILLVNDPFQNLEWMPIFTLRLLYRDFSLKVYRTPVPGPVVSEDGVYDLVIVWRNDHYWPR